MGVKEVTTNLNADHGRQYLNCEEDDSRHVGKRQSGMQRRHGIAEPLDTAYGAGHRISGNVCFACL